VTLADREVVVEFEGFIAAELSGLTRFAGVLTGDRELGHDVLVDALLIVMRRWPEIAVMTHPTAYVRRVVVSCFLADRRKTARRRTTPTGDHTVLDGAAAGATPQVENRHLLDGLLRQLPRQQRTAVVLRYYLDYDDAAIGSAMATSTSGVRSNIARALATMRINPDILDLRAEHR
jgi:DNA-directed RNA polymerase specialized sigma24 family protein